MKSWRMMKGMLTLIGLLSLWATGLAAGTGWCAGLPKKGDTLPLFELQTPESEKAREYLGLSQPSFRLGDIPARLVLVEIIGVYCPQCYQQAPLFNTLFNRIEKGKLKGQVKMLAIAAGGNNHEIKYLYEQVQYSFPVTPDPKFEVHKLLGEPRTPFTLLVDPQGKVLYTHMGVVENVDTLLKLINELVR
jgi:peroxiredoxin